MPELPEVETIRRDLSALLGKKIIALQILSPKIASHSVAFFKKSLLNEKLVKVERRGKLLILSMQNGFFLLIHLKMTGQLIYQSKEVQVVGGHSLSSQSYEKSVGGKLPNKHTRAIFNFSGGGQLFFNDIRKFGYLKLVKKEELDKILKNNYGPEPLSPEFNVESVKKIFKTRRTSIKAVLLNQKLVSGLGNIYVDEALFASKILPTRLANSIKEVEIKKLVTEVNKLIKKAIEYRGTTFSNYVDSKGKKGNFSQFLKVYGRGKEKCFVCGHPITKVKMAGRGTHYCQNCQK